MNLNSLIIHVLLAQALAVAPVASAQDPAAEELIREGVRLHDQGDFDAAISRFSAALVSEPRNAEAIYELANTYSAVGAFDQCISTARRGIELESWLEAPLYTVLGTCYSVSGQSDRALRAYRRGLKKHPDSVSLNFNIAVTLAGLGKNRKAIDHLRRAIETKPSYPSPYYLLAQVYEDERLPAAAIMLYLKFVTLEPNSERSVHASNRVFSLLHLGVSETSPDEVVISIDPDAPHREGDFSVLEVARAVAAAATFTEDEQTKPPSQRAVDALRSFLQMSRELTDESLAATFAWKHAAATVFALQDTEALDAFLYLIATRAEVEGAADWLHSNPSRLDDLNEALASDG